jgi:hypothetical protein
LAAVKFLNKELRKKRTKKEWIVFIKSIFRTYGKALKQYIKDKLNLGNKFYKKEDVKDAVLEFQSKLKNPELKKWYKEIFGNFEK